MTINPLELVSIDPEICHGEPVVKGTRVLVTVVLAALAAGLSVAELGQDLDVASGWFDQDGGGSFGVGPKSGKCWLAVSRNIG